jgi:TusA-related sulfurtransferase
VNPPALTLDARGLLCPLPVIELGRRFTEVDVGEVVVLLSDDPAASSDVPAWCEMRGQRYLGEQSPGAFAVRRLS